MMVPASAIPVNHFFEVDGVTYIKNADDPTTGEVLAQDMDGNYYECKASQVVRLCRQPEAQDDPQ